MTEYSGWVKVEVSVRAVEDWDAPTVGDFDAHNFWHWLTTTPLFIDGLRVVFEPSDPHIGAQRFGYRIPGSR